MARVGPSLSENLAASVMGLIVDGGLKAGDHLPSVAQLAEQAGVTTPTMREALRRLEATGSIALRHGSGLYVGASATRSVIANPNAPVRPHVSVEGLARARLAIEPSLAGLAAANRSDDDLARLRLSARNAELSEEEPVQGNFHREVAAATGNPILGEVIDSLLRVNRAQQGVLRAAAGHDGHDADDHVEILEAIEAGDAAAAVAAMTSHLERLVRLASTS